MTHDLPVCAVCGRPLRKYPKTAYTADGEAVPVGPVCWANGDKLDEVGLFQTREETEDDED